MAVLTGQRILLAFFLKRGMASDAGFHLLFAIMTSHTALLGLQSMHGLFEFDVITLFGSLNRMALNARAQPGMVTGPARGVVAFMGFVIEWHQLHALGLI